MYFSFSGLFCFFFYFVAIYNTLQTRQNAPKFYHKIVFPNIEYFLGILIWMFLKVHLQ